LLFYALNFVNLYQKQFLQGASFKLLPNNFNLGMLGYIGLEWKGQTFRLFFFQVGRVFSWQFLLVKIERSKDGAHCF